MTPEELARQAIDQQLDACGWIVQDLKEMNIYAGLGVAVREFALKDGEADYLLYADGKVIGVVEAKPAEHGTLTGVEGQSVKYITSLPVGVPAHHLPVPFHYESTGTVTQFTNLLDPSPRSRPVLTFHRPDELLRLVALDKRTRSPAWVDQGQHHPRRNPLFPQPLALDTSGQKSEMAPRRVRPPAHPAQGGH
jgi:type I restriction enzyme R subunit